jgi:hypothetical protein
MYKCRDSINKCVDNLLSATAGLGRGSENKLNIISVFEDLTISTKTGKLKSISVALFLLLYHDLISLLNL